MAEKKTSIHVDEGIWGEVEEIAKFGPWTLKNIVAAALLRFCSLEEDEQWKSLKKLTDFRKGLVTLPKTGQMK